MREVRVHSALSQIDAAAWDELVAEGSPFLEHAWLSLLEETACACADEGWVPRHITVWEGGRLVAAAPTYVKLNSMGEFVYDWSWANAARQIGVPYYPKLIVGVPFTPVTGRRVLTAADQPRAPLVELVVGGLIELASRMGCAGLHVLFCGAEEAEELRLLGGATRLQFQFHWTDKDYGDFDGFLGSFSSKRRSELKRERRRLGESGVVVRVHEGDELQPRHIEAMQGFYENTCARFGGWAYLKPELWRALPERFRDRLQVVIAWDGDRPIAGAFNLKKGERLYGRYWGAQEQRRFVHFEVCYYTPIAYCLERDLGVFEPGHGGGHKYPRGFEPQLCYSSHWIFEPRLARPIHQFLERERAAVREQVDALRQASPLRTAPRASGPG